MYAIVGGAVRKILTLAMTTKDLKISQITPSKNGNL